MRVLLLLVAVAALIAACSGNGDSKATPTPTLAPPPIDPRLASSGEGSVVLNVAAGARQAIDPLALARQAGTPPTCADFVFLFSFRSDKPVSFVMNRQGGADTVVSTKTDGQASVSGCILLEAVNEGSEAAKGELRYFIASTRR